MKRIAAAIALSIAAPSVWAGLLVTEVMGKPEIEGKGPIAILAEIPDGSRLNLPKGTQLTVVDLVSGREFLLTGARRYLVAAAGPQTVDGVMADAIPLPVKNLPEISIGRGKAAQATLVMRGMRKAAVPLLLSPVRTATITLTPTFRWNAVESAVRYRLTLVKPDGTSIWEIATRETESSLPSDRSLVAGERYTWRVEAIGETGALSDASTGFSVANADAIERLAKLKPDDNAPFSRRVLYAVQLREAGALAEAREIWKVLSKERPDDDVLKGLAD